MEHRKPIRVFLRLRPPIEGSDDITTRSDVLQYSVENSTCISVDNKQYAFSRVFDVDKKISQRSFYEDVARPVVDAVVHGKDGLILAYGNTSSGKTYSISGPACCDFSATCGEEDGILLRACDHLFQGNGGVYFASAFEIHGDEKNDLMDSRTMECRQGTLPKGIQDHEIPVKSSSEARSAFHRALQHRHTGSTAANDASSRSHAFFTLRHSITKAQLCVVDLAGSERLKNTHATGDRQKEGIQINLGLTVLRRCIQGMRDNVRQGTHANHIPVRESMLTRELRSYLLNWRNPSPTSFIVCINPAEKTDSRDALEIGAQQYEVARTKMPLPAVCKRAREDADETVYVQPSGEDIQKMRSSLNEEWLTFHREKSAQSRESQVQMLNKILAQENERQDNARQIKELIKIRDTCKTQLMVMESDGEGERHHNLMAQEAAELVCCHKNAEKSTLEDTQNAWRAEQAEQNKLLDQCEREKEKLTEVLQLTQVELEHVQKMAEKNAAEWEEERGALLQRIKKVAQSEIERDKTETEERERRKRRLEEEQEENKAQQARAATLSSEIHRMQDEHAHRQKSLEDMEKKRQELMTEEQTYQKAKADERAEERCAWEAERSKMSEALKQCSIEKEKTSEEVLRLKQLVIESQSQLVQNQKLRELETAGWEKETASWKKQRTKWEEEKVEWEKSKGAHEENLKQLQYNQQQLTEEIENLQEQLDGIGQQGEEEYRVWSESVHEEWQRFERWKEECHAEVARWERQRTQFAEERAEWERTRAKLTDEIKEKEHRQRMAWEEEITSKRIARELEEWECKSRSQRLDEENRKEAYFREWEDEQKRRNAYLQKWEEEKKRAQAEVTRLDDMRARLTEEYQQIKRRYNVDAAAFENERASMAEQHAAIKAQWHHEKLLHQQELHYLQQQQHLARSNLASTQVCDARNVARDKATVATALYEGHPEPNAAPEPSPRVDSEHSGWPDLVRCTPKPVKLSSRSRVFQGGSAQRSAPRPVMSPYSVKNNRRSSSVGCKFFTPREYNSRPESAPNTADVHSQGLRDRVINSPVKKFQLTPVRNENPMVEPEDAVEGQTSHATSTSVVGFQSTQEVATGSDRHLDVQPDNTLQDDALTAQGPALSTSLAPQSTQQAVTGSGRQLDVELGQPETTLQQDATKMQACPSSPIFLSQIQAATESVRLDVHSETHVQEDALASQVGAPSPVASSPIPAATGSDRHDLCPETNIQHDVWKSLACASSPRFPSPIATATGSDRLDLRPERQVHDDARRQHDSTSALLFGSFSPLQTATPIRSDARVISPCVTAGPEAIGQEGARHRPALFSHACPQPARASNVSLLSSESGGPGVPTSAIRKCTSSAEQALPPRGTTCCEKPSAGEPDVLTALPTRPPHDFLQRNKSSPLSLTPVTNSMFPLLGTLPRIGVSGIDSLVEHQARKPIHSPRPRNQVVRSIIDIRTPSHVSTSPSITKSLAGPSIRQSPAAHHAHHAHFPSSPNAPSSLGRASMDVEDKAQFSVHVHGSARSLPQAFIPLVPADGLSQSPPRCTPGALFDLTQSDTEQSSHSPAPKNGEIERFGKSEVSRDSRGPFSRKTNASSHASGGTAGGPVKCLRRSTAKNYHQQQQQHLREQQLKKSSKELPRKKFLRCKLREQHSSQLERLCTHFGLDRDGDREALITRLLNHNDEGHNVLECMNNTLKPSRNKTAQPQQMASRVRRIAKPKSASRA